MNLIKKMMQSSQFVYSIMEEIFVFLLLCFRRSACRVHEPHIRSEENPCNAAAEADAAKLDSCQ